MGQTESQTCTNSTSNGGSTASTGRRRQRHTVRAANVAMLHCISEPFQPLAAEALAKVITRQSQAGASLGAGRTDALQALTNLDFGPDADVSEEAAE